MILTYNGTLTELSKTIKSHLLKRLNKTTQKCEITMPFPRVFAEETSVTMAVHRLTFPLLIPPTILAITNTKKFVEIAHSM